MKKIHQRLEIYTYIYHIYHICLGWFESVWVLQLLGEAVTQDFVEIVQMPRGRLLKKNIPVEGRSRAGDMWDSSNIIKHQSWNIIKAYHPISSSHPKLNETHEIHQDHIRSPSQCMPMPNFMPNFMPNSCQLPWHFTKCITSRNGGRIPMQHRDAASLSIAPGTGGF